MIVRKFSEAKAYEAPNHRDYKSFRVFGAEMGGSQTLVFGISHFLPGGGAGPDASPPEKIYYVLAGELTVIAGGKETVVKAGDSCLHRPQREPRDRQSQQRGLHHRGRRRAGEVTFTSLRAGGEVERSEDERAPRDLASGSSRSPAYARRRGE